MYPSFPAAKQFEAKISAGPLANITTATADLQLRLMVQAVNNSISFASVLSTRVSVGDFTHS